MSDWPTKQAPKSSARPELRPAPSAPASAPEPPRSAQPSAASKSLSAYYLRVEQNLIAQGLLRTDGGGIDTPYSEIDLIRNFERIAFYDEYARGGGLRSSDGTPSRLKRWTQAVRLSVEFGASVPDAQRAADRAEIARYTSRLARITGHPISISSASPNFHVFIVSEDDRKTLSPRIRQIVPSINGTALALFDNLPRSIHCFVIAFSGTAGGYDYAQAIALIRAEHPPVLRKSCMHEEIAQGLGLANDSPRARPSIFNDDDEFAFLTTHDEELLRLLYNPRLRPGMSLDQARPIYSGIAANRQSGGQAL